MGLYPEIMRREGEKNPALRVGDCCVWGERKAFLEEFMAELCLKD